jgi:hypothetical protein
MPESGKPIKRRLPRDSAGSLELQDGTGGITAMCPCGDFLEVYKEDITFRVRTPESIDPDRTNPNAPFVAAVSDRVGSASPAVARVLLQGHSILSAAIFREKLEKDRVVQVLHACKEALVVCEKVAARVALQVDKIIQDIEARGIPRDSRGRALNPLPQVSDLELEATNFLIHAKRAIQLTCRLPSIFLPVSAKDNNFDALAKTLTAAIGENAPVTKFVAANASDVRYLIELRNYQEHPGAKLTVINNFAVMPNKAISMPMWHVSGETPRPIREEMQTATEFLVQMTEVMLIRLVMHTVDQGFPFIIQKLDAAEVNPKMPIKYRLSIDISKLKINTQASN